MDEVTILKNKAKQYLDNADEKTIQMIYGMLEGDAQNDWGDDLPESAKNLFSAVLKDFEKRKRNPATKK